MIHNACPAVAGSMAKSNSITSKGTQRTSRMHRHLQNKNTQLRLFGSLSHRTRSDSLSARQHVSGPSSAARPRIWASARACFGSADALRYDTHSLELAPPRHLFAWIRKGTARHIPTAITFPTATGSRPALIPNPLSSSSHCSCPPCSRTAMRSLCARGKVVVVQRWIVAAGVRVFGQANCNDNTENKREMF